MMSNLFGPRSLLRFRIVTMAQLNRALSRVRIELRSHGFWNQRLAAVDVYLVPIGAAYGWQWYRSSGEIDIPAVSIARLGDLFRGSYTSLADVLRHEYGHALADTHQGLFRSRRFREAFAASHEDSTEFDYDAEAHVSAYASTRASEDFAETFMFYLRHKGQLPATHSTPIKRKKWQFLQRLSGAVRNDWRTWSNNC